MLPALPVALRERHNTLDLFFTLTSLIHEAGAQVEYGNLHDDATWDAAAHTLTLRADAEPAEHTWALAEFCRHLTFGASHFVDAARRHLYAVS